MFAGVGVVKPKPPGLMLAASSMKWGRAVDRPAGSNCALNSWMPAQNPSRRDTVLNSHSDQAILAIMKKASITEAKNNLSSLIDSLKSGSPVLIVDRGRPVARLEPVASGPRDADGRLERLPPAGVVRRGP